MKKSAINLILVDGMHENSSAKAARSLFNRNVKKIKAKFGIEFIVAFFGSKRCGYKLSGSTHELCITIGDEEALEKLHQLLFCYVYDTPFNDGVLVYDQFASEHVDQKKNFTYRTMSDLLNPELKDKEIVVAIATRSKKSKALKEANRIKSGSEADQEKSFLFAKTTMKHVNMLIDDVSVMILDAVFDGIQQPVVIVSDGEERSRCDIMEKLGVSDLFEFKVEECLALSGFIATSEQNLKRKYIPVSLSQSCWGYLFEKCFMVDRDILPSGSLSEEDIAKKIKSESDRVDDSEKNPISDFVPVFLSNMPSKVTSVFWSEDEKVFKCSSKSAAKKENRLLEELDFKIESMCISGVGSDFNFSIKTSLSPLPTGTVSSQDEDYLQATLDKNPAGSRLLFPALKGTRRFVVMNFDKVTNSKVSGGFLEYQNSNWFSSNNFFMGIASYFMSTSGRLVRFMDRSFSKIGPSSLARDYLMPGSNKQRFFRSFGSERMEDIYSQYQFSYLGKKPVERSPSFLDMVLVGVVGSIQSLVLNFCKEIAHKTVLDISFGFKPVDYSKYYADRDKKLVLFTTDIYRRCPMLSVGLLRKMFFVSMESSFINKHNIFVGFQFLTTQWFKYYKDFDVSFSNKSIVSLDALSCSSSGSFLTLGSNCGVKFHFGFLYLFGVPYKQDVKRMVMPKQKLIGNQTAFMAHDYNYFYLNAQRISQVLLNSKKPFFNGEFLIAAEWSKKLNICEFGVCFTSNFLNDFVIRGQPLSRPIVDLLGFIRLKKNFGSYAIALTTNFSLVRSPECIFSFDIL